MVTKLFDIIRDMYRLNPQGWHALCGISDEINTKDKYYPIYSLIMQREPNKSYGYKTRIPSYIVENQIITGRG